MIKDRFGNLAYQLAALLLAFGVVSLILISVDASPSETYKNIFKGSFGEMRKFAEVLVAFVPLLLVTAGLLVTFSSGLWNIGVEGQVVLGAIATTWVYRLLLESSLPPAVIIALAILGGMVGGAIWAALAGILKVFGGVNEIFGGLGLNFVSTALTIYLIFGPWKRPGVASMSGTVPFPDEFSLPLLANLRISPWALVIAFVGIVVIYFLLQGTYFGLRLKAVGKNFRAAYLLGIPTWQYAMYSFLICGALAGAAGAVQVAAVYHRLIPSISSGYGYLGLMVAMLINYQALWAVPVALFFAALNIGSIQLPIVMKLDSSLSGVLQGVLVLFVLLAAGVRQKFGRKAQ
ncbi:MAG: ABC transporter permease [Anaerolineaceae bacterium]|nr:MAG: ABC transporter permease [Chloroflexota bacterium]GJQ36750.1 MAG: ABC transporter permease [Anaerolineaceae bacterium]